MRSIDRAFYDSRTWREVRAAYSASVDGLCERCRRRGRITPGDIVHHKQHLTPENVNDPNIAYGWNNLELLCIECHNTAHGAGENPIVEFDADGNCIKPYSPLDFS